MSKYVVFTSPITQDTVAIEGPPDSAAYKAMLNLSFKPLVILAADEQAALDTYSFVQQQLDTSHHLTAKDL